MSDRDLQRAREEFDRAVPADAGLGREGMRESGRKEENLKVRVSADLRGELEKLADANDVKLAVEIRRALVNHVERFPGRKRKGT